MILLFTSFWLRFAVYIGIDINTKCPICANSTAIGPLARWRISSSRTSRQRKTRKTLIRDYWLRKWDALDGRESESSGNSGTKMYHIQTKEFYSSFCSSRWKARQKFFAQSTASTEENISQRLESKHRRSLWLQPDSKLSVKFLKSFPVQARWSEAEVQIVWSQCIGFVCCFHFWHSREEERKDKFPCDAFRNVSCFLAAVCLPHHNRSEGVWWKLRGVSSSKDFNSINMRREVRSRSATRRWRRESLRWVRCIIS